MGYTSQDIKPYEFDWPMVLLLDDPRKIADVAMERVWALEADGLDRAATLTLRRALEAIGPGSGEATRPRLVVGRELFVRQRAKGDLRGAMWTCGRLLLSESGSDPVWEWAMYLLAKLEDADMEREAIDWWKSLEFAYQSKTLRWDAVDWIEDVGERGSAPAASS